MAQDVIITKESKRIEAKVMEITDWQVMYHLKGDSDSSTYMMGLSRVASIIFENGEVFVPEPISDQEQYESTQHENVDNNLEEWQDDFEEETEITFSSGRSIVFRPGTQLENSGGKIYYGDTRLKGNDVRDLIKQTCPAAYEEYKKANRWMIFSIVPTCVGLGFEIAGIVKMIKSDLDRDKNEEVSMGGLRELLIGAGCLGLAIPFLSKSISHSENVYRVFNRSCAQSPKQQRATTLSFNVYPTGAGLTISF